MKDVYAVLKEHDVPYEKYEHAAVFTTAESEALCANVPEKSSKNLFLTNDKGTRHFLVTIAHDKRADLKKLGEYLGERHLRFASAERLKKYLGLTPGSVSPLGLINDTEREVRFLIDEDLLAQEKLYIHPNINTATVAIPTLDFKRLIGSLGYSIQPLEV